MTREDAHTRPTRSAEVVCPEEKCSKDAREWRRAWIKKGRLSVDLWFECEDGHRSGSRRYTASVTDDMTSRAWPRDPAE